MERGLRQGDPLSHFLLLIAAEALQVLTLDACNKGVYKGLLLAEDGANVSLLQYADVSGLKVNLSKSCLHRVGVPLNEIARVTEAVKAAIKIIKRLKAIRSFFLGGFNDGSRKMVWINWNKIIMEKGMGGLGVESIRAKNLSLLGKWMWRFHTEDTALWRKVIKEIHGPDGGFVHMAHRRTRIGLWNEIVKSIEYIKNLEIPLDNLIVRKIASGEQTRF
nr:RNA-directed DNA polymerase, eukaryota, reverse transcriptase zinc-binding domain protein [Tanacetum cinerariifolium]